VFVCVDDRTATAKPREAWCAPFPDETVHSNYNESFTTTSSNDFTTGPIQHTYRSQHKDLTRTNSTKHRCCPACYYSLL